MNSRCISVNSQLEHEFNSNLVYPQAIIIDDINENGKNEIIIGTANGEILVYKGSLVQPWLKFSKNIGCITCIAFDNVLSSKKKYLIVHDALGYVYLLGITLVPTRKRNASEVSAAQYKNPAELKSELRLFYQSQLLINPIKMIIEDLHNTGHKQMILLYTDRTVRVYNWLTSSILNATQGLSNHLGSSSLFTESGRFVLEQSWELTEQICSINVIKDFLNNKDLVATNPGGRVIICKSIQATVDNTKVELSNSSSSLASLNDIIFNNQSGVSAKSNYINICEEIVNFLPDSHAKDIHRTDVQTFLVPNVVYNKSNQYAYLITMNGDVYFFKMTPTDSFPIRTYIWHRSINAIVLKCYKVDINNDENEELMIATPDGQIFSINCSGDIICFDLGEPIKAFHIGLYSSESSTSSTSLNEPGTSSETNLCQSNQPFETAINIVASPISYQADETASTASNSLCVVFISSLANKICLLQADAILPYSKKKPSESQFKYKCANIFTNTSSLNPRLYQALETELKRGSNLPSEIVHKILYS